MIKLLIFLVLISSPVLATDYYISPTGSDSADGLTPSTPFKTFNHATDSMLADDTLILLDGTYTHANNGGIDSTTGGGADCDLPPNGSGSGNYTTIMAQNAGSAIVEHRLQLGSSAETVEWVKVQGISFLSTSTTEDRWGGCFLYNANYCYIKDCGFQRMTRSNGNILSVGTNDIDNSAEYNIIEDCWAFGEERVIGINYNTRNNVWRRVVFRGNGADYSSGNPGTGFTIYSSQNNIVQNVIVLDRLLGDTPPGANFANPQADPAGDNGNNTWEGCISIKAPGNGANFEASNNISTDVRTWELTNCAFIDSADYGFNSQGGNSAEPQHDGLLNHVTVLTTGNNGSGIRIAGSTGTVDMEVRNSIVEHTAGRAYFFDVGGTFELNYCQAYDSGVLPEWNTEGTGGNNIVAASTALYLTQPGSTAQTGSDSTPVGATIEKRIGVDGTRVGDPGVDTVTSTDLWPFPNEDRIKSEMETVSTRGFCSTGNQLDGSTEITLTSYIWEYLGTLMPEDIYDGTPQPPSEGSPIGGNGDLRFGGNSSARVK